MKYVAFLLGHSYHVYCLRDGYMTRITGTFGFKVGVEDRLMNEMYPGIEIRYW